MVTTKQCWECGNERPLNQFYNRADGKHGKGTQCKSCHSKYMMRRWISFKERAIEYKGGKCADCKQSFHRVVYDFHHRDPAQKDVQWNKLKRRSWDRIVKELDKCDLLCANCHRLRHLSLH